MAFIQFVVDLVGGDVVEMPVTVTTVMPVPLTLAGGPATIDFRVDNPLSRPVILDNVLAVVIVGDPALVTVSMLDTVMAVPGGGSFNSQMTVTPNQPIEMAVQLQVEVTASES